MNADGSNRAQLTTDPEQDFDPVWSPDGAKIAFRSHRNGNAEIYVMDADGSDQTNLTNYHNNDDWSPAWSPDGAHIAFASMRPEGEGIWVMQADGSNPHPVATPPGVNDYPSWSPDSQRIAWNCTFGRFLYGRVADFEICVVNADGTGLAQLTDTEGNNKFPAWSPDGSHIAFVSDRLGWPTLPDYTPPGYDPENYGDMDIYIMNAAGLEQVNLTNHPREDDDFPAWSRDGRIVFTRYGCLMVMNPDGSGLAPIASCAEGGHFPDWYQPPATTGDSQIGPAAYASSSFRQVIRLTRADRRG
jgi:Tol biopolymer transport system component